MKMLPWKKENGCFLRRFFAVLGSIFFISCGLDVYYVLYAPSVSEIMSEITEISADSIDWYVRFRTNDTGNASEGSFTYRGTGVYYKIYNNESTAKSHYEYIDNALDDENLVASIPSRILETYGYQPLNTYPNFNFDPFVADAGRNQDVQIRLKSVPASTSIDFMAYIMIGGRYLGWTGTENSPVLAYYTRSTTGSVEQWSDENGNPVNFEDINFVIPYRSENKSFDFFDDDETQDDDKVLPVSGDSDYNAGTQTDEDTYYVQLYATAMGYDAGFTNYYSDFVYLGTIPIKNGQ